MSERRGMSLRGFATAIPTACLCEERNDVTIPVGIASTMLPAYELEIFHHKAHEEHEELKNKSYKPIELQLPIHYCIR